MAFDAEPTEPTIWGAYGPCQTQAEADASFAEHRDDQDELDRRADLMDRLGLSSAEGRQRIIVRSGR